MKSLWVILNPESSVQWVHAAFQYPRFLRNNEFPSLCSFNSDVIFQRIREEKASYKMSARYNTYISGTFSLSLFMLFLQYEDIFSGV